MKVLMKAGRQLPVLLDTLQQADKLKKSALVCNCGLPDERVILTFPLSGRRNRPVILPPFW